MFLKTINSRLIERIFIISRSFRKELRLDKQILNLTIIQIQTLIFLSKKREISMSAIASFLRIKNATATSLLNKLFELNLVRRISSKQDRRVVKISLTGKGEKIIRETIKERNKKIKESLKRLTYKEKESLLSIMEKII